MEDDMEIPLKMEVFHKEIICKLAMFHSYVK